MVRINSFIHDSIVDGPGIRSVIFTQGCIHNCVGCHNQSALAIDGGYLMSIEDIVENIKENNFSNKVTISGGEPLIQTELIPLVKALKKGGFHVMMYSGYTKEEIEKSKQSEVLNLIDILVDGKYEHDYRNIDLLFKGSSNQEVHIFNN